MSLVSLFARLQTTFCILNTPLCAIGLIFFKPQNKAWCFYKNGPSPSPNGTCDVNSPRNDCGMFMLPAASKHYYSKYLQLGDHLGYMHTYTRTRMHAHAHAHAHTRTRTHTHTHTQATWGSTRPSVRTKDVAGTPNKCDQ